jgi:uncharacterized protein (TIGR02444 family)
MGSAQPPTDGRSTVQPAAPSELFRRICAIYGRDGAADLCLRLQDSYGFDVSLGLSALVDGQMGRTWSSAMLAELRQAGWQARASVTQALRRARGLAKPLTVADPAMAALYAGILRQELAAEELSVRWLEAELAERQPGPANGHAAAANLRLVAGPEIPQPLLDALQGMAEG